MELDNSATSFIIIILTIVTISYVVYTNYNSIVDMKNKLYKLEQVNSSSSSSLEEEVVVLSAAAEEPVAFEEICDEDCLLSKDWENNVPCFLPVKEEYIQLQEITLLESIPEEPIVAEVVKPVEVAEVVKPVVKVSVKRRKTKQ